MIPYIHIPTFKLFGFIPIQPFGILVALGILLGYSLARRRARAVGLDADLCADGMVWMVAAGFIVGHIVSVVFYFPERISDNPLSLLEIWNGLSSVGGVLGGVIGAYLFFSRRGYSMLEYIDAILYGAVPAWVLGRAGCAVVHDHIGRATNYFFAVRFPGGSRHDLGFEEMLYLIGMTAVLYALKNVRPFRGFPSALVLVLYAPARFLFDFLRASETSALVFEVDKRYLGLTPAQYSCVGMVLLAAWLVQRGIMLRRKGVLPSRLGDGASAALDGGNGRSSTRGKRRSASAKTRRKRG